MTELLVLMIWSGLGVLIAVAMAQPGEPKLAWAPFAVILGPMWATVAIDRRMVQQDRAELLGLHR